ncbi:MAG TPA: FHA domain-containing protein, partial [Acidobacteriota bacterium]|nr:FHA domain-containing protein [Acidobacteriota bacterium]
MPARLIIESDIDQTRQEISFDKPRITIGRKPGNDLHFNRPEISGTHAAFLLENDTHYVSDLGSTNGTLLNGAPIVAREKYPLTSQDVVTITPYRIRFEAEIG